MEGGSSPADAFLRRLQDKTHIELAALRERRERIATAVLAGLMGDEEMADNPDMAAEHAVSCADSLIAELDK